MTDTTSPYPTQASRLRGSFWWGLPIAVACIVLGHVAAYGVGDLGGDRADTWPLSAFVFPFAAWTGACLLRRRWWSLAGSIVFPVALAALWIFVISTDMGC